MLREESPPPTLTPEQLETNAKAERAMRAIREIEAAQLPPLPDAVLSEAACRGHPPEWWFSDNRQHRHAARVICERCPVRAECEQWARARPLARLFGIWGGTLESDRKRKRERSGIAQEAV